MPKTIKNVFLSKLTFEKMLSAHIRASKGKKTKKEVIIFEMELETNLIRIMDEIKNNTYKFGEYREFVIHEPKERIIKSLPYRDRIVHQWYVEEFIKPYFMKRFINDTYACLDNRGTHKSVICVQNQLRNATKLYGENYYILKTDIKKYFYSIDKEILLKILSSKIKDKKLLEFSKKILDDGNEVGIPIGNYTSQFFANIYLNELDHYVKDELKIKFYTRYMDDQIFILKTKAEAKEVLNLVSTFVSAHLNLLLNHKSRYYPNKLGVDFCGYIIYPTHILLRKLFKKKVKKSIKQWIYLKNNNIFYDKKFLLSYNSFLGHASHSNSYNYVNKIEIILYNNNLK